jgi:DNA-directed RNA polymerase specialized sigma subunit
MPYQLPPSLSIDTCETRAYLAARDRIHRPGESYEDAIRREAPIVRAAAQGCEKSLEYIALLTVPVRYYWASYHFRASKTSYACVADAMAESWLHVTRFLPRYSLDYSIRFDDAVSPTVRNGVQKYKYKTSHAVRLPNHIWESRAKAGGCASINPREADEARAVLVNEGMDPHLADMVTSIRSITICSGEDSHAEESGHDREELNRLQDIISTCDVSLIQAEEHQAILLLHQHLTEEERIVVFGTHGACGYESFTGSALAAKLNLSREKYRAFAHSAFAKAAAFLSANLDREINRAHAKGSRSLSKRRSAHPQSAAHNAIPSSSLKINSSTSSAQRSFDTFLPAAQGLQNTPNKHQIKVRSAKSPICSAPLRSKAPHHPSEDPLLVMPSGKRKASPRAAANPCVLP